MTYRSPDGGVFCKCILEMEKGKDLTCSKEDSS